MKNLIKHILKESDFDWTDEAKPMSMGNSYVIDVSEFSVQRLKWLLEDLRDLGYGDTHMVQTHASYIYMDYEYGEFKVDFEGNTMEDPTWDGKYKMIDMDLFNTMFYQWKIERDKGMIDESEFEWVDDGDNQPHIGKKYLINNKSTMNQIDGSTYKPFNNEQRNEDEYIIITVNDVTDVYILYDSDHFNGEGERLETRSDVVNLDWFYDKLIDTYWLPYEGTMNESEFDWVSDVPTFDFPKDKQWFILVSNTDELREVEELIRQYGYINFTGDLDNPNDNGEPFWKDSDSNELTAIEYDPESSPAYDGRYADHAYLYDNYGDTIIHKWSDIKQEFNESDDLEWMRNQASSDEPFVGMVFDSETRDGIKRYTIEKIDNTVHLRYDNGTATTSLENMRKQLKRGTFTTVMDINESEFDWVDTVDDPWVNVSEDVLNQIDQNDLDRIVSILDNEIDLSKSDAYEWDVCHSARFEIQEVIIDEGDDIVVAYISYCNEVPTHLSLWFDRDTHDYNIA